jgi:hypothetical protein
LSFSAALTFVESHSFHLLRDLLGSAAMFSLSYGCLADSLGFFFGFPPQSRLLFGKANGISSPIPLTLNDAFRLIGPNW